MFLTYALIECKNLLIIHTKETLLYQFSTSIGDIYFCRNANFVLCGFKTVFLNALIISL